MMLRFTTSLLLLFICGFNSFAQSLSISGVVKDNRGETLPGAGIYLSNYKKATVTGNDGKFTLGNLQPGNYDVLVEMMGYLPFTKNVVLSSKSAQIEIRLSENMIQLNEVVIRVDPNRERYVELFKDFFIGKTPNAEKCKLLNPQALIVDYDNKANLLTVKSNEFLILENKALGYRLKYMLQFFEYDYKTRIVYYAGLPNFEDLKGSTSRKKSWAKARETAYQGSSQHFFRSLFQGSSQKEGFIIHKRVVVPNTQRPSDEIIEANIKRLLKAQNGIVKLGTAEADSLSQWTKVKQMPKAYHTLNRAEVLTDTLVQQPYRDLKSLNYADDLYVIYTKERETNDYTDFSGHSVNRPLDMPNYQISVAHMIKGPVHFYAHGGILENKSFIYEGFWAYEKIADMVPMDYVSKSMP